MIAPAETGVVVDTNIITYILSNRPADVRLAERYRPHLEGRLIAISFQTEAELLVARERQQWDREAFQRLLSPYQVVPWSEQLRACYVRVRAAALIRNQRGQGPKLDAADGWVVAAALMLDQPLVTHDEKLSRSPLIEVITEL